MSEKDVQMLHSMSDNLLMDAREALGVSSDAAYVSPNHQSASGGVFLVFIYEMSDD